MGARAEAKRQRTGKTVKTIVVCCGAPKLSMGWFHLTQLLKDPKVELRAVVEPFLLGAGKDTPGGKAFAELRASLAESHPDLEFLTSVSELPDAPPRSSEREPLLALIAGRTCDAPALFADVVAKGATHVYVEKPGAENAEQLAGMRDLAKRHDVAVVVGYNKNVAKYTRAGLAALRECAGTGGALPEVTLQHCNEFKPGPELVAFMSGPGAEGMLHNMCCHELALAVSLFGVTCDRVVEVALDEGASELVELEGGASDWARVSRTNEISP